jgi:hypothetical protein
MNKLNFDSSDDLKTLKSHSGIEYELIKTSIIKRSNNSKDLASSSFGMNKSSICLGINRLDQFKLTRTGSLDLKQCYFNQRQHRGLNQKIRISIKSNIH